MIKSKNIHLKTKGFCDLVDLTEEARKFIRDQGVQNGQILIFAFGSTCGITTIEYEPNLIRDFKELMEKLVPQDRNYHHNRTWGDNNGFSHLRASLIGPSVTVPIKNGELKLGTWQQIVLCDFDNQEREREVILQVFGE